jgi:hypothetical protein
MIFHIHNIIIIIEKSKNGKIKNVCKLDKREKIQSIIVFSLQKRNLERKNKNREDNFALSNLNILYFILNKEYFLQHSVLHNGHFGAISFSSAFSCYLCFL